MPDACASLITGGQFCQFYRDMNGRGAQCGKLSDTLLWCGCIHEHVSGTLMCGMHSDFIENKAQFIVVCGVCDTIPVVRDVDLRHKCPLKIRVELDVDWQRALRSTGPGWDPGLHPGRWAVSRTNGEYR